MNERDLLALIERTGDTPWHPPPASIRRRARRLPDGLPVPLAPNATGFNQLPADVRGTSVAATPEAMYVSRSLPDCDIGLLVRRTHADALIEIEGRIWTVAGSEEDLIEIVWTAGDHVLSMETVRPGQIFVLRGAAVTDWQIEAHLGDGRSHTIGPAPA